MKILMFAAVALLAGCAGLQSSSGAPGAVPQRSNATGLPALWAQRDATLIVPRYFQRPAHPDHGSSWMLPQKKMSNILMYVEDQDTGDEYVYNYPSGGTVGILSGVSGVEGSCVDAKGDVYFAEFDSGTLVEYAHGGKTPIKTYSPGGTTIGCSVDSKGDVSTTSFDPGGVIVYAKGNPKDGTTYTGANCTYIWPMGYDDKDNLIGVGEDSSGSHVVCALLAGSKSLTTLTTQGITIDFPGGSIWDGKHIALGDQEAGGTDQTGLWPSTLSGTTISSSKEVTFSASCYNDYVDDPDPFVLGNKNTPIDNKQGKAMIGPNLWCAEEGGSGGGVNVWHYPGGGSPFKNFPVPLKNPVNVILSIGK
jgi:hypothetical protein